MGVCTSKKSSHIASKNLFKPTEFPHLSSVHSDIKARYDVIVIGSGYGASIAASRSARARQSVCVLERGKEWKPGEFPEEMSDGAKELQVSFGGKLPKTGHPTGLYDLVVSYDVTVVQGCGLGGGSLINANVGLECDPRVFEDPVWPEALRNDLHNIKTIDSERVEKMLKPTIYPDSFPKLHKTEQLKASLQGFETTDIEDLDKTFYKVPLFVNFEDKVKNDVGIAQPACVGCGNCCSGCNTGAKNTLAMNYIPDAKAHGAEIFCEVEVTAVLKSQTSSQWIVHYKRLTDDAFDLKEQIVIADFVFIGAGSLGSTKILLKSKERGLDVSDRVGEHFSTNGDLLGFSYNGSEKANCIGIKPSKVNVKSKDNYPPGPTITAVLDHRRRPRQNVWDGYILEDGAPPSILKFPFMVTTAVAGKIYGVDKYPEGEMWEKIARELDWSSFDNTLSLLGMSHDSSLGRLSLDADSDDLRIDWKRVGYQKNFQTVANAMEKVSKGLKGTFVMNPTWNADLGKTLICPHPLGGCIMGETGETGVVNHAGQVFQGESDEVFEGLLVVDGAIIPRSVGVNPVWTISSVAERCLRLLAQRQGWTIDYKSSKQLGQEVFAAPKPGLVFTERMSGYIKQKKGKNNNQSECEFVLTIQSDDVERMIEHDPNHSAKITGTVTCPTLSTEPMSVSKGLFQLFSEKKDAVETKNMIYKMVLTNQKGKTYSFFGEKIIHKDSIGEIGLGDTTTLFVKIFKGENPKEKEIASGVLKMNVTDFMKQLTTIEITNCESLFNRLSWKIKFGKFFAASLWDTYSGITKESLIDPKAPPRERRPLKLNGVVPEVVNVDTEDKVRLRLTRYNGGSKGPVLILHGLGVSSGLFTLDTVDTNLVEYLVAHKYDVWLYDFRLSVAIPWASGTQFTIDDVAEYDFPVAVDKIIEITGQETIQAIVHCIGSVTFFASLLKGKLQGKIRNIVSSQVATHFVGSTANKVKGGFHLASILTGLGLDGLSTNTPIDEGFLDKAMNAFASTWTKTFVEYEERCSSRACHRATLMYGLMWEHENMNSVTHDTIHELFGYANSTIFKHLAECFRDNKLVNYEGEDVYLPEVKHLNIPITFIHGEENEAFKPQTTLDSLNYLTAAHPQQDYARFVIPGYGHLDGLIGKNAVYDVFPIILNALDKYAQDDRLKDQTLFNEMVKIIQKPRRTKTGVTNGVVKSFQKLDQTKEISLPAFEEKCDELDALPPSFDGLTSTHTEPESAGCGCHDFKDKQKETLINWKPKTKSKCKFRQEPKYQLPQDSVHEKIHSVTVSFSNNTKKREIIAISDMHLGGPWSTNSQSKLRCFFKDIQLVAKENIHSLVLVGDVFEMWMYEFTEPQASREKMMQSWFEDESCCFLMDQVKDLTEKKQVQVYYIRGNHDHEITSEMVEQMFGPKVKFIDGVLIYLVNDDEKQYRLRFEHGHDYDMFNTYSLDDDPNHKPIGYFVARAMASSETVHITDLQTNLQRVVGAILDELVPDLIGSVFIDMVRQFSGLQKKLTEQLMEFALGRQIGSHEATLLENDQWVRFEKLFNWKYFEMAAKKFGSTRAYSMLKASLGEYDDLIESWAEDVVILAHTHRAACATYKGKNGKIIYINTGCWLSMEKEVSYVRILTPQGSQAGQIEISSVENEHDS